MLGSKLKNFKSLGVHLLFLIEFSKYNIIVIFTTTRIGITIFFGACGHVIKNF
jgi:hypothetical protein